MYREDRQVTYYCHLVHRLRVDSQVYRLCVQYVKERKVLCARASLDQPLLAFFYLCLGSTVNAAYAVWHHDHDVFRSERNDCVVQLRAYRFDEDDFGAVGRGRQVFLVTRDYRAASGGIDVILPQFATTLVDCWAKRAPHRYDDGIAKECLWDHEFCHLSEAGRALFFLHAGYCRCCFVGASDVFFRFRVGAFLVSRCGFLDLRSWREGCRYESN